MSVESLREEIENWLEIKMKPPELIDHIRKNLSKKPNLEPVVGKKGKGVIVMGDLIGVKHPVLKKLADPGNMSKRINREASDLIEGMVDLIDARKGEDLRKLESLAREFLDKAREISIDFILNKTIEAENDLRPTMMPGSVGRDEIPNLYMPTEEYKRDERVKLALQLCRSVAVGNWISIYFEGPFHNYLKQLIRSKFNRPYLESEDIGASSWEMNEPFVTLLRMILWAYGEISEEREGDEIIEMMKSSSGIIYFTPKSKERYTAFSFPQLNRFVDSWLQRKDRRKILESMLDSVKLTSSVAYGRRRDAAAKQVELIYRYFNLLATSLIERASIPWEPLRKMVDAIIDLAGAGRYNVPVNLYFVMMLGETDELGSPQESGG